MSGSQDCAIRKSDRDGVGVDLFVVDVCMFHDEVAGGASVREGVLLGTCCWLEVVG